MSDKLHLSLLRRPEPARRLGVGNSSFYALITAGLMTRPVRLGPRISGWPEYEVDQVVAARIAGWRDEQIRALVHHLHDQRAALAPDLPNSPHTQAGVG